MGVLTERHNGSHLHPLSPDLPHEIGDDGEGGKHVDFRALLRLRGGVGEEQESCGCDEVAAGEHGTLSRLHWRQKWKPALRRM